MKPHFKILTFAACCAAMHPVWAQQAPDPVPAAAAPAPAVPKPRTNAQAEAGEPRANISSPTPAVAPAPAKGKNSASPGAQKPAGNDRLDLGTATVTGDREQPKVMYIVPWKSSTMGDLAGKPMNSLVDEILAPVDRDVFKREVTYYQAIQSDASQNGASAKPSP